MICVNHLVSTLNHLNEVCDGSGLLTYLPQSPRRDVCPGCCGGGGASGWRPWSRQRPASPLVLQALTACPAAPALLPL